MIQPDAVEHSAGVALIRLEDGRQKVLVIQRGPRGYELPKGHLEEGETCQQAARRELIEETGILTPITLHEVLYVEKYEIVSTRSAHQGETVWKDVTYFLASLEGDVKLGEREEETQVCDWLDITELETAPFRSDTIKSLLRNALKSRCIV